MKKIIKAIVLALVIAAIGTAVYLLWNEEKKAAEPAEVTEEAAPEETADRGVIS